MAITSCYKISLLTFDLSSLLSDNSSDTLARRIHVIERLEHLLVIKLSSRIQDRPVQDDHMSRHDAGAATQSKESQSQSQVELVDKAIASKLRDTARIRCVCLPDHEHARILLGLYLTKLKTLNHFCHAPTLKSGQQRMYAQLSRAEIPNLVQIALFLSIFATNRETTLSSRYWQMTALYILAEQTQLSSLRSVEAIQTIFNILLLKQQEPGSSETFRSLLTIGMSLSSQAPTLVEESDSTIDIEIRTKTECQIERMSW
jgi:hypothetical protein